MNVQTSLRTVIYIELVLGPVAFLLAKPPVITTRAELHAIPSISIAIASLTALVIWLISVVGLLRMRRWGAWTRAIAVFLGLIMINFFDFPPQHGTTAFFEAVGRLLEGLLLGIAFFTDAIFVGRGSLQTSNCTAQDIGKS